MNPAADKHSARAHGRAARRCVAEQDRPVHAAAAAALLLGLPELRDARVVLAYHAMPEEIDPAPALASLRERGCVIALPRVSGPGRLALHRVGVATPLVPGPFGLLEPHAGAPLIDPADVDAAIVPGVLYDTACRRVGHGGGYYDRLLPELTRAVTIGLAFDCQVVDEVATEGHDACVDVVVTPSTVLRGTRRD